MRISLTGTTRHRISIHGAGPATRLLLKEEILEFDTFAALSLRDLSVVNSGEPRSFSFLRCQELHLSHVLFFGRSTTGSSLLRITGAGRLLIEGCSIFATAAANNEKPDSYLNGCPALLPTRMPFRPLASIDGSLTKAAEAIAALSPAERKKLSSEISATCCAATTLARLNSREQTGLNNLRLAVRP
jgi:hypothetical protein